MLEAVLFDTTLKAKGKAEAISRMLITGEVNIAEVLAAAETAKGSARGTCIEAIEFATKTKPAIATLECLEFLTETLLDKAPRVRWESARTIANIAHLYPDKLDAAVCNLLINSEFPGTVVRWSAALALGEIIKLQTNLNKDLIPAAQAIIAREPDNAIKKIYQAALKSL
jgi:hypothetical protein